MGILLGVIRILFRPAPTRHGPRRRPAPERIPEPGPVTRPKVDIPSQVICSAPRILRGRCYVIDGDTIVISDTRIRLAGIDAPELDHPWGQKAKWALIGLCKGQVVTAELSQDLSYDRLVATCYLPDGRDLAAEMVRCGLAIDWPKFSGGKYGMLEPAGIRQKHWRAHNRQFGRMPPGQIPD